MCLQGVRHSDGRPKRCVTHLQCQLSNTQHLAEELCDVVQLPRGVLRGPRCRVGHRTRWHGAETQPPGPATTRDLNRSGTAADKLAVTQLVKNCTTLHWTWISISHFTSHFRKQIRNSWRVLKYDAGKGCGKLVRPIMWEWKKCYTECRRRGISYIQQKGGRLTGLVTYCVRRSDGKMTKKKWRADDEEEVNSYWMTLRKRVDTGNWKRKY